MCVPADDDVGAGGDELPRERALVGRGTLLELDAPVEEDDDGVGRLPCGADLLHEPWDVLRRREPRLARAAVQAEMSWSSSTCVAPMTAIRWPLIVRRNGRYACFAFRPMPTTGKR